MSFHKAMPLSDLWCGEMAGCRIAEHKILLVHTEQGVCAFEDRCAHLGVPLSQGSLAAGVITCSAHHYQYDACSGQGINPRTVCLKSFNVTVEDGVVYVDVAPEQPNEAT